MHCLNAVYCHRNAQLSCALTTFTLTIIKTCLLLKSLQATNPSSSAGNNIGATFQNLSMKPLNQALAFCASLCNFLLEAPDGQEQFKLFDMA